MTSSQSKEVEKFIALLPRSDTEIRRLVEAAFNLYQWDWKGKVPWYWPVATLQAGEQFHGNEPWTILLREAVILATTEAILGK